ncbi:MAG: deoxyribodipyrimidine photo-lyase [Candidatus Marinimicrobia bacterium]|nr:deoxyribodipyrimidine photo-lyase [Candidatus Neomarinimicrobiota bacterium]MCF7828583.1 deoxyribodipyrimidine photo-lyase [Candidatus Neomarinimicrobiota bacterium]MCF7880324.1 deoxyribodipyrimidine photo-lyase [Candidatus Neomarinimicrobiota bacterium]
MQSKIHPNRIQRLNNKSISPDGSYVLYWMQASQRAEWNHALEYAIERANAMEKPLIVVFGITDDYPDANERHYAFMLQGLQEAQQSLAERGIRMVIRHQPPARAAIAFARDAVLVVTDRGYLRFQRVWRSEVAESIEIPLIQVETGVIVPVEVASEKREYAARTIRPKIHRHLEEYLKPVEPVVLHHHSLDIKFESFAIDDVESALASLDIDPSVPPVGTFTGGTSEAKKHLREFIENRLDQYDNLRNDPTKEYLSNMSPYLQFGQISPLYIAMQVEETESPGKESYLEELIIRRELSMNFCYYDENYDNFECLPGWAKKSLDKHADDEREYLYSLEEFENAKTHDPYWNAAQMEMVKTGKMHGYMRMYWGKKILEWSESPQEAYQIAIFLNNTYELDGRNPNGYAGVAWCFGNHDQGWKERPVYGKVRYMNANGLKRKFDAEGYVEKVKRMARR